MVARKKVMKRVDNIIENLNVLIDESNASSKVKSLAKQKIKIVALTNKELTNILINRNIFISIFCKFLIKINPEVLDNVNNMIIAYNNTRKTIYINLDAFDNLNSTDQISDIVIKHELGHGLDHLSHPIMFRIRYQFSAPRISMFLSEMVKHKSGSTKHIEMIKEYFEFASEKNANDFFNLTYKDFLHLY